MPPDTTRQLCDLSHDERATCYPLLRDLLPAYPAWKKRPILGDIEVALRRVIFDDNLSGFKKLDVWAGSHGVDIIHDQALSGEAYPNGSRAIIHGLLILASGAGSVEIVRYLIARGMDVNAKDNSIEGVTALHRAADIGALEIMELLIAAGADKNAHDNMGVPPAYYAALHSPHYETYLPKVRALLR